MGNTQVFALPRTKRIEEITVGDIVFGYDGQKIVPTKVLAINHQVVSPNQLLTLQLGGPKSLKVTKEHPFYTAQGQWIEAANLRRGDELFMMPKYQAHSLLKTALNPLHNENVKRRFPWHRLHGARWRKNHRMPEHERKALAERMKTNNPMFHPEALQKVVSKTDYHRLGRISWTKRQDKRPSAPEQYIQTIIDEYQLPVWYCGDGKFWVKNRNPDFKVHGQKKVIEVYQKGAFGEMLRDDSWAPQKQQQWRERKYECLTLEVRSVACRHKSEIAAQIQQFVSNGLVVRGIKPYTHRSSRTVFNLQTETENYFVRPTAYTRFVLVHNCHYLQTNPKSPTGYWCPEIKFPDRPYGCCDKYRLKNALLKLSGNFSKKASTA